MAGIEAHDFIVATASLEVVTPAERAARAAAAEQQPAQNERDDQ